MRKLVLACGLLSALFLVFHIAFWWLFDWPARLGYMTAEHRMLMQTFNLCILPIFAFANAGIPLVSGLGDALTSSVSWGVALGLIIGKPLGITLFAWAAARTGLARLPRALTMRHIFAVGWVGGIGFTISLFVTELAFRTSHLADLARVGILFGSLVAGSIGFLVLRATLPPPLPEEAA